MPQATRRPQFEPANTPYVVKPRGPSAWQKFNTARLLVSIGNESYEGDKMLSLSEWIAPRFKRTIVVIHDTIQRYNFSADGLSASDAFEKANQAGLAWRARHTENLKKLPSCEIFHWQDILALPFWQDNKTKVESELANNGKFNEALCTAVDALIERRRKQAANFNEAQWRQNAISYLIEEASAYVGMYEKDDASDIYPGTRPEALNMVMRRELGFLADRTWSQSFTRLGMERRK